MPKIYGYTEILGDILITGSFSVLGSASTINTTNLVVSDTIISLGHSQSGSPVLDEGIMFGRGTGLTQAFIWDETNDTFALIGTNDDHTVVGSINIDSYSNLIVGGLTTSTVKITNGANSGYILTSDSSGNATWIAATSASANFANTNLTFTGNRSHNTNGNIYELTTDNGAYSESWFYMDNNEVSTGWAYNQIVFSDGNPHLVEIRTGGGSTASRLIFNSTETVVNESGYANYDFRIEGNTDQNLFFVDSYSNNIGIGTNTPAYKLEVSGTVSTTGFRMTNGAVSNYILTSDSTGLASWTSSESIQENSVTTILFDKLRVYNTRLSPLTGNLTADLTDSKLGMVQKIYHNDSITPTLSGGNWNLLSGTYTPSALNIIYAEWVTSSEIEYWII
jgi:hypothetical protein